MPKLPRPVGSRDGEPVYLMRDLAKAAGVTLSRSGSRMAPTGGPKGTAPGEVAASAEEAARLAENDDLMTLREEVGAGIDGLRSAPSATPKTERLLGPSPRKVEIQKALDKLLPSCRTIGEVQAVGEAAERVESGVAREIPEEYLRKALEVCRAGDVVRVEKSPDWMRRGTDVGNDALDPVRLQRARMEWADFRRSRYEASADCYGSGVPGLGRKDMTR